jgi:TRIAD3 protein (E3 ubiquitin-protein ligase RNF216)
MTGLTISSYVCSKDVNNYEHFGEVGRGRCPLHENVEDRHEQEVKKAADEAMAKVRADNPGVSDSDLMIKVSDRVKQAEDARKGRGQAQANVFPYHMVDNQIQHRMPRPPPEGQPPDLDHHVVRQRIQAIPQMPVPAARYVPFNPYAFAPVPIFVYPLQPVTQYVPFRPYAVAQFSVSVCSTYPYIQFHHSSVLAYLYYQQH